jgi:hypothetical protein
LEFEDGGTFLPFSFSEEALAEPTGILPSSVLFQFGDAGSEEGLPSEPAGEHRTVAMVEVDRAGRTSGSVVPQIIKDNMAPKFSGEPCDFEMFRWEFERFLSHFERSRPVALGEDEKLILLERALPDREKRRLMFMQKARKGVTYQSFMRDLESVLSPTQDSQIHKRWNELSMRYGGKITLEDVYNFQLEFDQLRHHLSHLTEGECHRHLIAKLPNQLVNYVHDEETRLQLSQPQVLINLPGDFSEPVVKTNMEVLLKVTASRVIKQGPGSYLFTLTDSIDVKRALEANGRSLRGTGSELHVKDVRRRLSIQEVFEYLRCRLESRERADQYNRSFGGDRGRSPNRDNRNVRIAEKEEEPGGGKSKGKKGKSRSASRSLSPSQTGEKKHIIPTEFSCAIQVQYPPRPFQRGHG